MFKIPRLLSMAALAALLFFSCKSEPKETHHWKNNDNTVRVRQGVALKTLNPYLYRFTNEVVVFSLIFQELENFPPTTMALTPELVQSSPVIEKIEEGEYDGGQRFTYEIRPEATWDDGKPIMGSDFVFTIKVLFNPRLPMQRFWAYYDNLKNVEVDPVNPRRFTVFTNNQYFLSEAAISTLYVLPEHIYDPEGLMEGFTVAQLTDLQAAQQMTDEKLQKFADEYTSPKYSREVISGSGPYRLSEWVEDQRIVLVKKENWWGEKVSGDNSLFTAYPDTLLFLPIPDQTATIAALSDESVDVATEVDAKLFNEFRQSEFAQGIFDFHTPIQPILFYAAMNNRNPKLSDKKVRRALALSMDIDGLIETAYEGLGSRLAGPFFPSKPYYEKSLQLLPQDFEKARSLLKEAGWEDSNGNGIVDKNIDGQLTELELNYMYVPSSNFQVSLFQAAQANAKKIGIDIQGEQLEANVMRQRLGNGDYEMAGHGGRASPVDDDPKQLWHTDSAVPGGSNYSRFGNAESDALIDAIRNAETDEERYRLYKEFQRLVYDEQPVIFLFAPQERIVAHKRFGNVITNEITPGISLRHLKLKE